MDYSLLLVAEKLPEKRQSLLESNNLRRQRAVKNFNSANERHAYLSVDGRLAYHIGVIDYLQVWNR